jgi:hypothetical protein
LCDVPVVQLFERIHYADALGRVERTIPSVMHRDRQKLTGHAAPGGAWAARRDVLQEIGGLYPYIIVGGGDDIFAHGIRGTRNKLLDRQLPGALVAHYRQWQRRAFAEVEGRVGCVAGDAVHLFHGTRESRQYSPRNQSLQQFGFHPALDVRVTAGGLLEWSSDKPALHQALREYFLGRREDA